MSIPFSESRSMAAATARERDELAWFEGLRSGDETAFELLFRSYAGPLCAFAFSYLDSQEAAQEVVEEPWNGIGGFPSTVSRPSMLPCRSA